MTSRQEKSLDGGWSERFEFIQIHLKWLCLWKRDLHFFAFFERGNMRSSLELSCSDKPIFPSKSHSFLNFISHVYHHMISPFGRWNSHVCCFSNPSCFEIQDSPSAGPKSGGLWWKMLDLAPAETTPETVSSNLAGKSENQMGDFPASHVTDYQRGRRY